MPCGLGVVGPVTWLDEAQEAPRYPNYLGPVAVSGASLPRIKTGVTDSYSSTDSLAGDDLANDGDGQVLESAR